MLLSKSYLSPNSYLLQFAKTPPLGPRSQSPLEDSHSNSDSNSGWHHSNPPCASTTRTSTPGFGEVLFLMMTFQLGRESEKSWPKLGSPDINVAIECSILTTMLNTTAVFGWKGQHASWFLKHHANNIDIFQKIANANGKIHSLGHLTEMMVVFHCYVGFLTKLPYFWYIPPRFDSQISFWTTSAKSLWARSWQKVFPWRMVKTTVEPTPGGGHTLVSQKNVCKPKTHPSYPHWGKQNANIQRLFSLGQIAKASGH